MTYTEKIFDASTGETIIRELTVEEIVEVEKHKAENEARLQKELENAAARKAVIEKLGLTEEEAKALLG